MKLYVGNLPFSATKDEIHEMFSEHGQVDDVHLITDRETGRSRGFGFVEMLDTAAGNAAIKAFHEKDMGGRPLTVNEARPRTENRQRG